MKNKPTIIAEKVYEGLPGEGYECGLQFIDESGNDMTQSGYFGHSPEQAFVRMLINESTGAVNLARGVIDEVEKIRAIVQFLADKWNIDLMNLPKVEYTIEERFNASKVSRLSKENSLLLKENARLQKVIEEAKIGSE